MNKYIKLEDAIEAAINGCASWDGGYFPSMDDPIKDEFASVEDKCIELVRCKECKYYKDGMCYNPNTYDDEKTCGNTTADWFCADGERKDGERKDGE